MSDGDVDGGIARLLVAVKKGFDEAMVDLGAAYDLAGLEVDKGVSLWSAESVFSVGKRFEDGDGVQKNAEKAVEWYTRGEDGRCKGDCCSRLLLRRGHRCRKERRESC